MKPAGDPSAPASDQNAPAGDAKGTAEGGSGRIDGDDPRVQRVLSGDRQAAASLLGELLPRTRNVVRFFLRDDSEVDDVAQNALVEVLRSLQSFRGESALTTWSDRIAARCAMRHVGRQSRARTRQRELSRSLAADAPSLPIDRHNERYAARRELSRVLDGLPEAQRQALVMHHVLGLSVPELAQELGVSFDTAKSRLRLGMERLRRHYRPQKERAK